MNNYITSASLPVRKTREPSVLPEPRRRTVCGRWLYVVVSELLFVFINRTHLTFNLTSCFFLRLLLHFVTIKASRRAAAALWCLVLSVCDGGGGASLGFLTQLLSFCGRAISFLLHGLQTVGRNEHAQFYLEMHLNGIDLNCCCWINLRRSLFCSPEKLLSFFHFCLTASRLFGLKWGQNTPSARPCRPTRGLWGKKIDAGAPNEVVVVVVTLLNLFRNIHM